MTLFLYGFLTFPWLTFIARNTSRGVSLILAILLLCIMLPEPLMSFFDVGSDKAAWLHYFGFLWAFGFAFAIYAVTGRSFEGTFILLLVVSSSFLIMTLLGIFLVPFLWVYLGFVAGIAWLFEKFFLKNQKAETDSPAPEQ